jgi:hypothetical protein
MLFPERHRVLSSVRKGSSGFTDSCEVLLVMASIPMRLDPRSRRILVFVLFESAPIRVIRGEFSVLYGFSYPRESA